VICCHTLSPTVSGCPTLSGFAHIVGICSFYAEAFSSAPRISVRAVCRSRKDSMSNLISALLRAPLTVRKPTPAETPLTIACVIWTPALPSSEVIANPRFTMLDWFLRSAILRAFHFPAAMRGCWFRGRIIPHFLYILYHKKAPLVHFIWDTQ
jgi:hypothetical protein